MSLPLKLQSLRFKIIALVALFTLLVIGFCSVFLNAYYEKLKIQNSEYLMSFANEKTANINNYISARRDVLEYFANENQLLGENFLTLLRDKKATQSHYRSIDHKLRYVFDHFELYDIFIISDEGDILYTYKKESDLGLNLNSSLLKESHFSELYKNSRILMQTLHSSFDYYEPSQSQALFITSPIYHEKKYLGTLAIQIDLERMMQTILSDISTLREDGEAHIVRMMKGHKHELIYSNTHLPLTDDDKINLLEYLNQSEVQSHDYISSLDKSQGLMKFIPFLDIDLIVKANAEDIFHEFRFIRNLLIYFFLSTLVAITILLYIFNRQVLKPIEKLNKATDSFSKGDYNVSLELDQHDEISALGDNFIYMGQQIEERTQQLEAQTTELNQLLENFDKHVIASSTDLKGNLTYVSEAFCYINGYTKEELIGKSQNIGRHPDMSLSVFKELWDTISVGKTWKGEIQNLAKDGRSYWVDVIISPDFDKEGNITGYSAIRHDVTAKKELKDLSESLEQTVRERTRELNKAQEIGKIGHWKLDLVDKTLFWSDEVYRIMGLKPGEIQENYETFKSFVHPDDRDDVDAAYLESVKNNTPYSIKHRICQQSDGIRYVEEVCEHMSDESGSVVASFGIIHDITDLTNAELELKRINSNLENRITEAVEKQKEQQKHLLQQSKMAAMGEMIGMIAHQWRQPLSAVSVTVTKLKIDLALNKFKEEVFDKKFDDISHYVELMSHTIDDFRNFFKSDKQPESVELTKLIDTTLDLVKLGLVSNHIHVSKSYRTDTPLNTYKNELIQVLLNLIKNAEDNFIEQKTQDPTIEITTYEEDETQIIKIKDNGGGIPQDYLEKIFEPYFSTKDEKNGTGLGLYMSKTIIEEHCKGTLSVRNEKGGAEFTIKLQNIMLDYDI